MCYLASIADYAAGFDVEADVADSQARLVAESGDEAEESPDVGKICGDPDGGANGAGAFVSALLHQAEEAYQVDVVSHREGGAHVFFGQALGNFPRAGIAEAASAQRN